MYEEEEVIIHHTVQNIINNQQSFTQKEKVHQSCLIKCNKSDNFLLITYHLQDRRKRSKKVIIMKQEERESKLIIVDYNDLLIPPNSTERKYDLTQSLSKAFSSSTDSLGIIAIRNIPSFLSTKREFLPLAHKLAHLPAQYLEEQLTDEASMYNSGWSHGKEKLGDKPDFHKASFYFNPITDTPGTKEDRETFPVSYPCNKWPEGDMLPELEIVGKRMGTLMRETVALLATHVDLYVRSICPAYGKNSESSTKINMGEEMRNTEKVKGRLLYYYPLDASADTKAESEDPDTKTKANSNEILNTDDSWIGWHNDSGFFTALSGDMFVNHETGQCIPREEVDPNAGLYVMNRRGESVKVDIPDDCMAVQIGECLQIITGGVVVATPHCVRGVNPKWNDNDTSDCNGRDSQPSLVTVTTSSNNASATGNSAKVARISFPCFVDTVPSFPLKVPDGISRRAVLDSSVKGCAKVPPLFERFVHIYMLLCLC